MGKKITFVVFLFLPGLLSLYAWPGDNQILPGSFTFGKQNEKQRTAEEIFFLPEAQKKSQQKNNHSIRKFFTEDENNYFSVDKDHDPGLYAPPPGIEGNPQKVVTPSGKNEWIPLLVMALGWILCKIRKQRDSASKKRDAAFVN